VSALLLIAALAGAPPQPPRTLREWIGDQGLALVAAAREVEVLRLAPSEIQDLGDVPPSLRHLDVKATHVLRDPVLLARLATLIQDDAAWPRSSYLYEVAFMADVAFRFEGAGRDLELLACLGCDTLVAVPWGEGEWVFDLKGRELLEIALEAFPDDRPLGWLRLPTVAPKTPEELLGPVAAILAGATASEALAVEPGPRHGNEIADHQVIATHPMEPALVGRLTRALSESATYEFGVQKRCAFRPNVAFRVHKGAETGEVILCFGCSQMGVNAQDAAGRPVHLAGADFRGEELWEIAAAAIGRAELERISGEARH
jgi:hypothetical protein